MLRLLTCNPAKTKYVYPVQEKPRKMFNHSHSGEPRPGLKAQKPVALISDIPRPVFQAVGGFDKEDIVIIVLSVILVVSTIWLATRIL